MSEENSFDQHTLRQQVLEEEIKTLNFRLTSQQEQIQFKKELIDSLKREMAAVNSRADRLKESLLQKNKQIDELHTSLIDKQKLLDTLQKEMLNRSGLLDQLKSKMTTISQPEASTEDLQVNNLQKEISEYENSMIKLRDEISQARKTYSDKEKMYTQSLEHMTRVIQDKESSLDETFSQLEEKELLISTLQEELKCNHDDLMKNKNCLLSLEEHLNEKDTELVNVRKGLTSWIDKVKTQNADLKAKESEIIVQRSQLKTQEREIQFLKAQLKAKVEPVTQTETKRKNPYEILGVTPESNFEDVKKAHRQAIKKYNPHIVETLGDDVKTLVIETSKEINLAFAWFKKKFGVS